MWIDVVSLSLSLSLSPAHTSLLIRPPTHPSLLLPRRSFPLHPPPSISLLPRYNLVITALIPALQREAHALGLKPEAGDVRCRAAGTAPSSNSGTDTTDDTKSTLRGVTPLAIDLVGGAFQRRMFQFMSARTIEFCDAAQVSFELLPEHSRKVK